MAEKEEEKHWLIPALKTDEVRRVFVVVPLILHDPFATFTYTSSPVGPSAHRQGRKRNIIC